MCTRRWTMIPPLISTSVIDERRGGEEDGIILWIPLGVPVCLPLLRRCLYCAQLSRCMRIKLNFPLHRNRTSLEYTPRRIRQSSIIVYLGPKKQEPLGDLRRDHEGRLTHKSIGETSHQQRTCTQNMCDHVYTIVIDPLLCVMRMITTMSDLNIFTRYWTPRTSQSPIVQGRVLELNELATNPYQK